MMEEHEEWVKKSENRNDEKEKRMGWEENGYSGAPCVGHMCILDRRLSSDLPTLPSRGTDVPL